MIVAAGGECTPLEAGHKRKACIAVRLHRFAEQEERLLRCLSQHIEPKDLVIVADETRAKIDCTRDYKKLGFDNDELAKLGLFSDCKSIGWLCGDYFYYVLQRAIEADTYWLIEPDVRFTYSDLGGFFRRFESCELDFVAPFFSERSPSWKWHEKARTFSPTGKIYGCAFPITRLTARAVKLLFAARQELSANFQEHGLSCKDYPNDESFVATTVVRQGLSYGDMRALVPGAFTHFTVHFPYPWSEVGESFMPNKVVHPALEGEEFWSSSAKYLNALFNRSNISKFLEAAVDPVNETHNLQLRQAIIDQFVLWICRKLPSDSDPLARRFAQSRSEASEVQSSANSESIPSQSNITVGKIVSRSKRRLAVADRVDFKLGSQSLRAKGQIDFHALTPYCFDYESNDFLLVDTPRAAMDEPFLYQAQYKHATRVFKVPLTVMRELYLADVEDQSLRPVFVFSIGRCGSTLFSRLISCIGLVSYSEPDIFTGINRYKADSRRTSILNCSVAALAVYAGVRTDLVAIKLRSSSSDAIQAYIDTFPRARFIFLKRNLRDWSASFIAKFGWSTQRLFRTLAMGAGALSALKKSNVEYNVLQYEDFSTEPDVVFRGFTGGALQDLELRKRLQMISNKDAQDGAGIRQLIDGDQVEKKVQSFLAHWSEHASPRMLSEFYVDADDRNISPGGIS